MMLHYENLKLLLKAFTLWVRFGCVTITIRDSIHGLPCEMEYKDRNGKTVGYWAYGNWDPDLPYKGLQ